MVHEEKEVFAWQVGSGHRSHFLYDSPEEADIGARAWLSDNPNAEGRVWIWRQTTEVVGIVTREED